MDDKIKEGGSSSKGYICTDSVNIQNANLTRFRSVIGLVSQEPIIFNLKIGKSIRYSKPEATQVKTLETQTVNDLCIAQS